MPIPQECLFYQMQCYASVGLIAEPDVFLQLANCTFDAHVYEIATCWTVGGSIVIVRPGMNTDVEYLTNLINEHKVSFGVMVPSLLLPLAAHLDKLRHGWARVASLRTVLVAGEAMLSKHLAVVQSGVPHATVVNAYGEL